ncbi:DUF1592 domain-containing protein [Polyangium aurulentum]|uniref:DUF1592 domain-containing protein n=1 Tax=Polyangium aurulentum TaxID=2567896 RepID=UPI00146DA61B|nr:DUF1592 domain-containing protein [Polyangium aurulentum]UQA56932.1 DUF1592 domain-containing protein [Polyangium aurulentum]
MRKLAVARAGGWVAVLACTALSCVGSIGGPDPSENDGTLGRLTYTCTEQQELSRGVTFDHMRRLSHAELVNTLGALLGEAIIGDAEIQTKLSGLPVDEMVLAGDFTDNPPVGTALALFQVSKRAVELAMASPAWKTDHLPSCAGTSPLTDACVEMVVEQFGGQVWRRDLGPAEVQTYLGHYHEAGADTEGLSYLLRRLLQSPSLVFHVEEGAEIENGRIRLTDFEVASRISYLTQNTMPDDALMKAARSGELRSLEGVRAHVKRLLAEEKSHAKVRDFFRYYARLGTVPDPMPAVGEQIGIPDTSGLGAEMRQEAFDFFDHVFWSEGGTFNELMSSSAAFPRSEAMARVFDAQVVSSEQPVASAPSHPGLLHRPALLTSSGGRTSPIVRGARLRKAFLCDEMGMPDPAAVAERKNEVGDIENMSNRDKTTKLTDAPACIVCHARVNGIGFAFEGFDQLGATRSVETVFNEQGEPGATWPIDTTAQSPELEPGGPESLSDSVELAFAMSESRKARACISRRLFEYYHASTVDLPNDSCLLSEEEAQSQSGTLQSVLLATIANEDIFWKQEP